MIVGILTLQLHLHGTQSLKEKRSIVRRILSRTQNKFNVSAAEVDYNDMVGRAQLAFVTVGNDNRFVNSVMDKVLDFVESLMLAEIVDQRIEVFSA